MVTVDFRAGSLRRVVERHGHRMGGCAADEAMQRLPLVVGGEQGWHSGRAPGLLAQLSAAQSVSGPLSPSQSLTTPVNLIRCCCPLTCSLCLQPRLHRRRRRHLPPSSQTQNIHLQYGPSAICPQRRPSTETTHVIVVVVIVVVVIAG